MRLRRENPCSGALRGRCGKVGGGGGGKYEEVEAGVFTGG